MNQITTCNKYRRSAWPEAQTGNRFGVFLCVVSRFFFRFLCFTSPVSFKVSYTKVHVKPRFGYCLYSKKLYLSKVEMWIIN